MGGKSSESQVVGYWYALGWHSVVCQDRPDAFLEATYNDKQFWSGTVTDNTQISINRLNLMGGDKKEGGLKGRMHILFGDESQTANAYMAYNINRGIIPAMYNAFRNSGKSVAMANAAAAAGLSINQYVVSQGGTPIPAYRNVFSVVFQEFFYAANNPYMKPVAFRLRRLPKSLSPTNSTITLDARQHANPAHIIYDVLTNRIWGLGFSSGDIDVDSFLTAAQTLYDEGFGLSVAWIKDGTAEEFINYIVGHIGAHLYPAPDTGKWFLKLSRADYLIGSLLLLDQSNVVSVDSFERVAAADLVNEVTVQYTDPFADKEVKITVSNLAATQSLGRINRSVLDMRACRNPGLAGRIAQRELVAASTPLSKIELTAKRVAWRLRPGDTFRFTWPRIAVGEIIFRVQEVDYGELRSGTIRITAVEDVFSLPQTTYMGGGTSTGWMPVTADLTNITAFKLFEIPYHTFVQQLGESAAPDLLADGRSAVSAIALRDNGLWTSFELHQQVLTEYEFRGGGAFSGWVSVVGSIPLPSAASSNITVTFGSYDLIDDLAVGTLCVMDNEWMSVVSFDLEDQTITLMRGVIDSIPAAHAPGTTLWLYGGDFVADVQNQFVLGQTPTYKLLPRSGDAILDPAAATAQSITIAARQMRPYPPANVKIGGLYYPGVIDGPLTVTWAHRDRTMMTGAFVSWTAGSVGPEVGVTYTIQIYSGVTLVREYTGITGTTWTYPDADAIADGLMSLTVRVKSVRDGYDSWQIFSHTFNRYGFGLRFGESFGGKP